MFSSSFQHIGFLNTFLHSWINRLNIWKSAVQHLHNENAKHLWCMTVTMHVMGYSLSYQFLPVIKICRHASFTQSVSGLHLHSGGTPAGHQRLFKCIVVACYARVMQAQLVAEFTSVYICQSYGHTFLVTCRPQLQYEPCIKGSVNFWHNCSSSSLHPKVGILDLIHLHWS